MFARFLDILKILLLGVITLLAVYGYGQLMAQLQILIYQLGG